MAELGRIVRALVVPWNESHVLLEQLDGLAVGVHADSGWPLRSAEDRRTGIAETCARQEGIGQPQGTAVGDEGDHERASIPRLPSAAS